MTQPEYEQKRAECWIEFCKKHPIDVPSMAIGEAFCAAFDRAYTLGREKETITQEEIESHSVGYATDVNNAHLSAYPEAMRPQLYPEYDMDDLANAFEAGANYALGKQETKQEIKQETDAEDTVIQGWVARSNDGPNDLGLKVYTVKPDRRKNHNGWNGHGERSYLIDCRLFPDLTWESEPEEVEIIIKRKKNG